jgi:hypothetical protein
MNTYRILLEVKKTPTYDEFDGFGDYVNYRTVSYGQIGAANEVEALQFAIKATAGLPKEVRQTITLELVGA